MEACGKDIGVKLKWLTMATSGTFEQGNMIVMDYTQYSPWCYKNVEKNNKWERKESSFITVEYQLITVQEMMEIENDYLVNTTLIIFPGKSQTGC